MTELQAAGTAAHADTEYANRQGTPLKTAKMERRHRAQVRWWLYITALALIGLVLIGGATRLTDSGLSITEWKPVHGVIPPLSAEQWQEEFDLYRQIPEYQLQNRGMNLDEFKFIYWWEWGHRFLARALGIIFAVPLVFFWATGRLDRRIKLPLLGILALGGLQGFIGWWMVSSGLTERVDVSHYRLAIHLTMAGLILGAIIWVARSIAPHGRDLMPTARSPQIAAVLAILTLVQIYLGGLVAGLDAGLAYNTWPLMGEGLFPGQMWEDALGWRNWTENPAIIQFTHRTGGYILFALYAMHMIASLRYASGSTHARRSVVLFALVVAQIALGVATLWSEVHVAWALAHQGLAFIVLAFTVAHWRAMRVPLPLSDGSRHSIAAT